MFEHKAEPLAERSVFFLRLAKTLSIGMILVLFSLVIGMSGYHYCEALSWLDSFVNAAMILSGMGPVDKLQTVNGKLFAGVYALYSGLVVILSAGVAFSPVIHRFFHRFHLEDTGSDQ